MLLVLKPDVVASRRLSIDDQQQLMQDIVDEALAQGVLTTRAKNLPAGVGATGSRQEIYVPVPAIKVCMTVGLSRKEVEKAGITIRHAITKVMTRKR